ncbi:MAG: phosphatidylserine decarboxylase [Zoogloeaceae bacterium]|jgi:phosphatidylserine decarboxylase|nr:phosphatidylserine decarboxylase [Zoogloeaceae bacterium]
MDDTHPLFAREGWPFLLIALLMAALMQWGLGPLWAFPFWLAVFFVLQFFRDPPRSVVGLGDGLRSVVSPADGRVVAIEECEDNYLNRRALKVSVFMNVFNVHSNRSPIDGEVRQVWRSPGKFVNAALDKASSENERCAMHLKGTDGQDVTCVQVAGLIARRILNYTEPGMKLARGQRYGFIRFGSRVDVYLPLDADVRVSLGDKVYAASTLLAEFSRVPHA